MEVEKAINDCEVFYGNKTSMPGWRVKEIAKLLKAQQERIKQLEAEIECLAIDKQEQGER